METAIVDVVEYKLCKRGHVRSPENLYVNGACRICAKIYNDQIERKEYELNRNKLPEVKNRKLEWSRSEKGKERSKKYRESTEVREQKQRYLAEYYKNNKKNIQGH